MIKPVIVATGVATLILSPLAAFAGPYVNIENNSGFNDKDFNGGSTDLHVGFDIEASDAVSLYLQGGPQIQHIKDADSESEYSGKLGGNIAVTERLGIYGEVSAVTQDKEFSFEELNVGTKIGAKFSF